MASKTNIENPEMWKAPLGDKAEITADFPETVDTALDSRASKSSLFPHLTEVPTADGGTPPTRTDFNTLFKLLGDQIYFMQQGGFYQWESTIEYKRNAMVMYNGAFYISQKGGNIGNPPSTDNGTNWKTLIKVNSVNEIEPDANGNITLEYVSAKEGNTFTGENSFENCVNFSNLPTFTGDGALDPSSVKDSEFPTMGVVREYVANVGGGGGSGGGDLIKRVTITSPRSDSKNNTVLMEFTGEGYEAAFENETRAYREWQYTLQSDTNWNQAKAYKSNYDGYALNFANRLTPNSNYKVRVRDVSNWGTYGPWSLNVLFSTGDDVGVKTPSITTITGANLDVPENPTITASIFTTTDGKDTHYSTQWVIRRLDNYSVVFDSNEDRANLTQINVPRGVLEEDTSYEVTVRYRGASYGWSDWGVANFTTAVRFTYVKTPSVAVENNGNNVPEDPYINTSIFEVVSTVGDKDTHASTSWRISDEDNVVVYASEDDTVNLRSLHVPKGYLQPLSTYTIYVQYKGRNYVSDWGETKFITAAEFAHIVKPELSVSGAPDSVPETATLSASAFTVMPQGRDHDTHQSTSWAIYDITDSAGGSLPSATWQSLKDTTHLTSITLEPGILQPNHTYLFTVIYHGTALGSSEQAEQEGTTKDNFTYIETPSLTVEGAPTDVRETPLLTGSAFKVISDTGESDTHISTTWKVSEIGATEVFSKTTSEPEELTSFTLPFGVLEPGKSYRFQVQYQGAEHGTSGWGTVDATTHQSLASIATPTLTIDGAPDAVPGAPTLKLSPFTVVSDNSASDTHVSTDYQIERLSDHNVVWSALKSSNLESIQVPSGNLAEHTQYIVKARFNGARLGSSDWAEQTITTMSTFDYINPPTLSIVSGMLTGNTDVLETPTFKGSAFAYTSSSGQSDTHHATEFKVTTAADPNTPIWSKSLTSSDAVDLTTVTMDAGILQMSQAYKVFVRYQGVKFGWSNWTSLDFSTNNVFTYIGKPTLNIPGAPSSVQDAPVISAGAFKVLPAGEDTHESSDWVIIRTLDQHEVLNSTGDATHLTSYPLEKNTLETSTEYTVKVRFKGATYGYSAWAEQTFSTAETFSPVAAPNLTIEQDFTGVYQSPLLTTSPMVNTSGIDGDIHSATDYKIMLASDRSTVWSSSSNTVDLNAIRVPLEKLQPATNYIFAVRFQALTSGWGPWTEIQARTQDQFYAANIPELANANIDRAGTKLRFEFSVPQLVTRPGASAPTHLRVKVRNNSKEDYVDQFTTPIEASGNYILERASEYDLSSGDDIEYHVFYKSDSSDNDEQPASHEATRKATVNENILVLLESISLDQNHVYVNPYIKISLNFGPQNFTHTKTDWEIRDVTNTQVIWSSLGDTTNKTEIWARTANLQTKTFYTLNIKAYGSLNEATAESKVFSLKIQTASNIGIGTPGSAGFGVGVCPDESHVTELGLRPLSGYDNPYHENYGNYEHSKGIFCYVPAFCYKFTDLATELTNAHPSAFDIRSFAEFNYDESVANEAGYILHQAFIDGGVAQKGFFIAKYLMSKGVKSVKNGITLSLTSTGNADASSQAEGNGASGVAHDAMTLSKTLGQQYNCASVYMYSAIAMLSYIHGIYSTDTSVCAWYDPEGTNNFPKGCNNNALGDCNDGEILYQNGDSKLLQKPNTGSANYFARTTHNGQACGICDVNGCIEQVSIGAIFYGQDLYVAAASAKFTAYTKDNANSTDSSLYVKAINLGDKSYKWGNATKNCLYTGQSGTNRALCGVWPNNPDSTGTNEFGNDQAYSYYRNSCYGVVRCAGSWSNSQSAGVWYRYMDSHYNNYSWAYSYTTWGFRSGAY